MDILERAYLMVQIELGKEIFSDEKRLRLSLQIRKEEGGDRHYIASTAALECQQRHAAVRRAIEAGATPPQAAERFGMSRQQVYKILARP